MGLVAFFQPFNGGKMEDGTIVTFSTLDLFRDLGEAANESAKATNEFDRQLAMIQATGPSLWLPVLLPMHGIALVLMLMGMWGVLRGRFGRIFGLFSLFLGLVLLGFGLLNVKSTEVTVWLPGLVLFLAAGSCGFLGGLVTFVKPDRVKPVIIPSELAKA